MSPTVPPIDVQKYRQLKAQALMRALAEQCRTPTDAVRFLVSQFQTSELRRLQQDAEAVLRVSRA